MMNSTERNNAAAKTGKDVSMGYESTVGQNNQEYRFEYWATRSSVRSCRSHRSLACLLCPVRFARALRCTHLLIRSLRSLPRSWDSE